MTKSISVGQSASLTEWKLQNQIQQHDSTLPETQKAVSQEGKQEASQPNKEKVEQVVNDLNKFLIPAKTSVKFEFHEKLEEYYVTIVDQDTKEVIKEIPPKKLLDIYAAMSEYLGFIVDEKI
ncbi:flagellar protein FlaG [Bacillus litorisediminis]|uniref:flagellar protein FlaG n=1 Tax=Bacillus litorisediminis TaxID=2922713 RepID=UPI001FAE6314|nr:flagellar protein FlaG [Bacillus litorisediminis]